MGGVPTGHVAVADANPRAKSWQAEVRAAAAGAFGHDSGPLAGPLELDVTFVLARPRSHYRTGRNAGLLRSSAPAWPSSRPDTTKLLRAVEDALTGIVWLDDAQVVEQVARKAYGWPERCEVRVALLEAAEVELCR